MKNFLSFDFSNLRGDFFGGLTAGIVALPLALAFGVSSGLGADAGLYGAIFISFFAALFGGTNTQISGPTAPMTAFSLVFIGTIITANDGSIEKALPIILAVFIMAGLFQILLGILGLGKYIRYIPYPVVSGFMTAIGVIILITQIIPALGYYPKEDMNYVEKFKPQTEKSLLKTKFSDMNKKDVYTLSNVRDTMALLKSFTPAQIHEEAVALAAKESKGVIGAFKILPNAIKNLKWLEVILALMTIFIIYGFKRITTKIPSTLVALVVVSAAAYIAKVQFGYNYAEINKIPQGLPEFKSEIFTEFSFSAVTPYIFTAILLALLGAIDSLLTSVVADNMTKTKHNPNRELIGQGIGNSIAAMFKGIPGAGATIRTVVNINAGGKTKISGMIAGLLLFFILLALGPVASEIPAAVLAGILITVGIGVMDYKGLKAIPNLPRDLKVGPFNVSSEVIIMLVVLVLSTVWNLVYAVGIGLVIASLMFMKKIGDLTAKDSDVKPLKEEAWDDEIGFPENLKEEVFIKHVKGPLFFGSTSDFQSLAQQIPSTASTIIIRLDKMPYMDQSGLYAMEDMLMDLTNRNKQVLLVGILEQPRYMMERIDIIPDLIPESQMYENFDDCLKWVKENVEDVV